MRVVKLLIITIIVVLLCSGTLSADTIASNELNYRIKISNPYVIEITPSELQKLNNMNEKFTLYIGRPTCSYCQEFLPKLLTALKKTHTKIYYIDSEKYRNGYLNNFRSIHSIKTIPDLSVYKNGKRIEWIEHGSKS